MEAKIDSLLAEQREKEKPRLKRKAMDKIKLAVYNEYALGYIMPERPDTFYTLKDSVLRGAPWRVMREPYFIGPNATVRLAGRKDFEDFGLSFEGYDDPMYEFDTTR